MKPAAQENQNGKTQRMTVSEAFRLAMTKSAGVGESIEVTRNAKGEWQFTVTARAQTDETLDDLRERVSATVETLATRFPYPVYEEIAT